MQLSIYTIAKNEEQMLEEAIKSVQGADEYVFVDTGSTDKTVKIAEKYTDKIFNFPWVDDFSAAKNFAASKCSGDWVMNIDADCRLEEGGIEKIRQIISKENQHDVVNVILRPINKPGEHFRGKIYRNNGKIFYQGMAHEDLNVRGQNDRDGILPVIYYDYSPNHTKDPHRYQRILTKQLEKTPNHPRYMFYLAREFYYSKDYDIAIQMFRDYIKISNYREEIAEAYLMMAECYWWTQRGNEAREACLRAIQQNPDFKKALKMMASMHYEPLKHKWENIADRATNEDVIFRT